MVKGKKLTRIVAAVALPIVSVVNGCYSNPEQARRLELRNHYYELKSKGATKQELNSWLQREEKAKLAETPKKEKSFAEKLFWGGLVGVAVDALSNKKQKTDVNDVNDICVGNNGSNYNNQ